MTPPCPCGSGSQSAAQSVASYADCCGRYHAGPLHLLAFSEASLVLCLGQERGCNALSLVIGMRRQMPDHSAGSGPIRQTGALTLKIE